MNTIVQRLLDQRFTKSLLLSLVDQFLITTFSFGLNLYLLRAWNPDHFGTYSIVIALSLIGIGVQSALVGTQLTVLRPLARAVGTEAKLLCSLWTANCILITVAAMLTYAVVSYLGNSEFPSLPASAMLYVGCLLLREYVRTFLFSEFRVRSVVGTDLIFAFMATTTLIASAERQADVGVSTILAVIA